MFKRPDLYMYIRIYIYSRNTHLRQDFSCPSVDWRLRRPFGTAFGCGKRKKNWTPAAPHSFKNFRRVMRIPNMCLVLKLDNEKWVAIANEQTDRVTEPSSNVL